VGDSNLMEQTSVFLSGLASAVNATPQSAEDQLGVFRIPLAKERPARVSLWAMGSRRQEAASRRFHPSG